jgi:DNA ligase 1
MRFSELVDVSAQVGATSSRHEKIDLLRRWLHRLAPSEISAGVHYLSGRLPQGRIGIGGALLRAARGAPVVSVELSLADVDRLFDRLARTSGKGSNTARRDDLRETFARASEAERDFLVRLLAGELRQGALEGVMLEAVATAADVPVDEVRRATMVAGDLGEVAQAALTEGDAGLKRFRLRLFQPLRPMLAQPADSVESALTALGEAALEYKLDGVRLQVHRMGEEVRIYSRRLNEVTASVPELVDAVRRLSATQLILDGEAIALRPDGRPLPFQTTMRRFGRKQDVDRLRASLPLSAFFFDCLHLEGVDLIARPARERFDVMKAVLPPDMIIPRRISGDPAVAAVFLEKALARGHEGLVIKSLQAPYAAGSRGSSWLKLKAAHTLDLVVLAAEWGNGRRAGRLSNLHLGARDPAGGFVMLGKTFKGMTDEMLAWQTERLLALAVHRDAYTVYVRPEVVVEIALNGVQASPHYPGGLALRFARVKRYREDKSPAEADTIDTVRAIYARESEAGADVVQA